MQDRPMVSVVIPVYKVEQYIDECICSVISQNYRNMEIILVDDGSPDNCPAICDQYAQKDNRIKVIHKKNAGLGAARNTGMDAAGGKYIIFLDSDDYWGRDILETLVQEAERKELQVIVFAAEPFIDGVLPEDVKMLSYSHNEYCNEVDLGIQVYWNSSNVGEYFAQACMRFCSLKYLRQNNLRFDEGVIHEDESWSFISLILADRAECLSERFYKRRYHSGSIMTSKSAVRSCQGNAAAAEDLLWAYNERKFAAEEYRKAILKKIYKYLKNILQMFSNVVDQEGICGKSTKKIRDSVDPVLKKMHRHRIPMEGRLRYYKSGILRGYMAERINKKMKRIYHRVVK